MNDRTYFSQLTSSPPHFILAGHTDDIVCNNLLQITSMEYALSRHLREQGFEAVVFYNRVQKAYCYDAASYEWFCNATSEETSPAPANPSPFSTGTTVNLCLDGPYGEDWSMFDEPQEETPAVGAGAGANDTVADGEPLGNRSINVNVAWAQIAAMLRGRKRTALVLSNMNTMRAAEDFTAEALNTLVELGEASGLNHSIAIYIFRGLEFAQLEEQSIGAGDDWERFANACLRPLICHGNDSGDSTSESHVIRVGTPNAAEIRDLLNHLRLRTERPLSIHGGDVAKTALRLAAGCSADSIVLKDLLGRIETYMTAHPDTLITPENCHELIGRRHSRTALEELETLIGLDEVKEKLRSVYVYARAEGFSGVSMPESSCRFTPRRSSGSFRHGLNVCLLGEPGTGKTIVARMLGRIYYEAGILPTAHVEEVKPSDIIESGAGASGRNMAAYVQRALGGVLFIDEAYGLSRKDSMGAGAEAITQLVGDMTRYAGRFAVVIAGYEKRILNDLFPDNEGFRSRFSESNYYHLRQYSWREIRDILTLMAEREEHVFLSQTEDGFDWLSNFCENWVDDRDSNWGNARAAENLLSEMKQLYAKRTSVSGNGNVKPRVLTPDDIPQSLRIHLRPRSRDLDEALRSMDALIGLEKPKEFLRTLSSSIRWSNRIPEPGNYIFMGPPGTGKTFFAEKMGEILNHLHVLRRRVPSIVNAGDLVRSAAGASVRGIADIVENARGGMLFIDEAHQLMDSADGQRIIRELVPLIEDPSVRADTCFVLAGYQEEMLRLLTLDSGLDSRFPCKNHIKFVKYTPAQLAEILAVFARERGYQPTEGYLRRTRVALGRYLDNVSSNFGNARFMRNVYLEESISRRTKRLNRTYILDVPENEREFAVPDEAALRAAENVDSLLETDIPETMESFAGPIGMKEPPERNFESRLSELIGKESLREFIEAYRTSGGTSEFCDTTLGNGMHFVIAGPHGSGRHTSARLLASMLYESGRLNNERPISRSKGDFEAEYVGQTVPKTMNVLNGARGNMLLVESPSSMLPQSSSDNTFGTEALSAMIGAMTSMQDISIVFIDTEEGMENVLRSVSGLRDQATFFRLEDLSPSEMEEIFRKKTENSFAFDDRLSALLPSFFTNWVSDRGGLGDKSHSWGNGTELDQLIRSLRTNWTRMSGEKATTDGVPRRIVTAEMFPEELQKYLVSTLVSHETAMRELLDMTGLSEVKEAVVRLERRLKRSDRSTVIPGCYCFVGNPGTGKTTVARKMGGVLRAAGVLSQGHVIERSASAFFRDPDQFDASLKLAKNGILFIDEAHQMLTTGGGQEVIRRLVTALEDRNILRSTSIILAGYPREMSQLIASDPGLNRRFGSEKSIITFSDYTPNELVSIMRDLAAHARDIPQLGSPCPLSLSDEYVSSSLEIFRSICAEKRPDFGNAGFVRTYLSDSLDYLLERQADRDEVEYLLVPEDIPSKYRQRLTSTVTRSTLLPSSLISTTAPFTTAPTEDELRAYASLVTVYLNIYRNGQCVGSGSGFIITGSGYILTCAHVVREAEEIRARVYCPGNIGSDHAWFDCTKSHTVYEDIDMAVIKLNGYNFKSAALRPAIEPIENSERILLSGYPLGSMLSANDDDKLNISHFFGSISSMQSYGVETIFADITGLHGNSGSPVFSTKDGRIIGLFIGSVAPGNGSLDENNYFRPIRFFWERYTLQSALHTDITEE